MIASEEEPTNNRGRSDAHCLHGRLLRRSNLQRALEHFPESDARRVRVRVAVIGALMCSLAI